MRRSTPWPPHKAPWDAEESVLPEVSAHEHLKPERPLRIPYGNKQVALQLGARYRTGRWLVPAGINLAAFRERGWL